MANENSRVEDAYDQLAPNYEEVAEEGPYNAELEFPETTSLVPDVDSQRILDAGCGSGRYSEWLLNRDANVVGVDVSGEMVKHARRRTEGRAEFYKSNLMNPFDFADRNEFNGIVSSLALDYIENWNQLFKRFARILQPGGFLVFSVRHPLDEFSRGDESKYFEVELREPDYEAGVPYYRRPISEVFDPLLGAGLDIDVISEPRPTEAFREKYPEQYERDSNQPIFLCVRAVL